MWSYAWVMKSPRKKRERERERLGICESQSSQRCSVRKALLKRLISHLKGTQEEKNPRNSTKLILVKLQTIVAELLRTFYIMVYCSLNRLSAHDWSSVTYFLIFIQSNSSLSSSSCASVCVCSCVSTPAVPSLWASTRWHFHPTRSSGQA